MDRRSPAPSCGDLRRADKGPDGEDAPFTENYYCTAALHK